MRGPGGLREIRAKEFMDACQLAGVSPCLQLDENETAAKGIKTMATAGVRYILVTSEKEVKGVASSHDLIRALKD